LFPDLSATVKEIADRLRIDPVSLQITPIRHGTHERNNVWRLAVAEKDYILKQHLIIHPIGKSAFSPFQIETAVLPILHRAGCRVPQIVWKSEDDSTLLLEACGEKTLDDFTQETPADALKPITRNAVQEFCRLELAFAECAEDIQPYIYPLGYPLHQTLDAILDRGRSTMNYLAWLSGEPMRPDEQTIVDEIWEDMSNCLHGAAARLGSLDYNARNVVIDGDRPTFIDFASVGWDWGERRLVQSFNSLGAHRSGGKFVSALNREVVGEYASQTAKAQERTDEAEIAVRVDYHNLLFYLSIIYRLLQATAQPEREGSIPLLKAWGDAQPRLRQAIDLLAGSPLSDNPYAAQLRRIVGEWRAAASKNDNWQL
jgi:hypothetical protein